MTMTLYGLKNCDTCRKALKELQSDGHDVVYVDVRVDGVDTAQLAQFHSALGEALLNTRSTTWRGLSDTDRGRAPLELLAEHPTLMKRPVIEQDGQYTLGWSAKMRETYIA